MRSEEQQEFFCPRHRGTKERKERERIKESREIWVIEATLDLYRQVDCAPKPVHE